MALQLKNLLMASYFAADHVVWAGQAGILSDKDTLTRYNFHLRDFAMILHRFSQIWPRGVSSVAKDAKPQQSLISKVAYCLVIVLE